MSGGLSFEIVGVTDTGRVRDHNEDSIGWDRERNLVVLADGMGGHSAGAVASKMAIDGILDDFRHSAADGTDQVTRIRQSIDQVNDEIYRRAQDNPDCSRMGTTLALACLDDGQVTIAHLGDSRVYRLRSGVLEQLTEDHSLVHQLMAQGAMTKAEAESSRYRNVITRALGVGSECKADIRQFEAQAADIYLLCSDGLSNCVSSAVMAQILNGQGPDWDHAARVLVDKALQAGGEDNISVLLAVIAPAGS